MMEKISDCDWSSDVCSSDLFLNVVTVFLSASFFLVFLSFVKLYFPPCPFPSTVVGSYSKLDKYLI